MLASVGLAFWLGILTSLGPCTMATNAAAISFIGGKLSSSRSLFWAGLLYAAGCALAYVALASLLVSGLLASAEASQFLQRYLGKSLGPLLIIASVFILEWVPIPLPSFSLHQPAQKALTRLGWFGPVGVGFLFSLSFCPVSAALFFVSLVPMAAKEHSPVLLPAAYGIGAALPAVLIAYAASLSTGILAKTYQRAARLEKAGRAFTGWVFLMAGIYLTAVLIYI